MCTELVSARALGFWATDVQPVSSLLPLEERRGQGLSLLLIWFLARYLFIVGDWSLACTLNSTYVELLLFFVLSITFSCHSIWVSLSVRDAHWGFLTNRSWKVRTVHTGLPKVSPRLAPSDQRTSKPSWISLSEPEIAKKCGSKTDFQTWRRTRPVSHGEWGLQQRKSLKQTQKYEGSYSHVI